MWFRLSLQYRFKHLTRPANLHFLFPILLNPAFAYGPVNKPAQVTGFKLPGRTTFPSFSGTLFYDPAGPSTSGVSSKGGEQKKHLPLYVGRHRSPPLFVAMHSL